MAAWLGRLLVPLPYGGAALLARVCVRGRALQAGYNLEVSHRLRPDRRRRGRREGWWAPDPLYYRTPRARFKEWGWRLLTYAGCGAVLYGLGKAAWDWLVAFVSS
jgi:hypothetical protein